MSTPPTVTAIAFYAVGIREMDWPVVPELWAVTDVTRAAEEFGVEVVIGWHDEPSLHEDDADRLLAWLHEQHDKAAAAAAEVQAGLPTVGGSIWVPTQIADQEVMRPRQDFGVGYQLP